MRLNPIALTIITVIAVAGSHVAHTQVVDHSENFGDAIGGDISAIAAAALQGTKAPETDIQSVRQEYFACYPDCPELEARRKAFAIQLGFRDLFYLTQWLRQRFDRDLGGDGDWVTILEQVGKYDGGIDHQCKVPFDDWNSAVYESMGRGLDFNYDRLMPALEVNNRFYEDYLDCRDKVEFEKYFGFTESGEDPGLRRSALVAIDGNFKFQDYDSTEFSHSERASIAQTIIEMADSDVKVLMCEYGPFENSTGSAFFKPYKIREAWYKSPPANQAALKQVREHPGSHLGSNAMACCPETNNKFLAVRTGKTAPPSCEGSAAPPTIKSSLFFWQPKGGSRLSNFGTNAEGKVVCSYRNGETVKFDEQQLARVLRGKCPQAWAPEFPVDYEQLSSNEIRYTYTNGQTIVRKNWRDLADYWLPDKTRWWRLGDPSE